MELLIDLGNTRTKWALLDTDYQAGAQWQTSGNATDLAGLLQHWLRLPPPRSISGCAVGCPDLQQQISDWTRQHWHRSPGWLRPAAGCLGLSSDYDLTQLGSDRWATLAGARSLYPDTPLLIVSAGTACVLDSMSVDGRFLGGMILPGYRLQRQALHQHTARLPLREGEYREFPHNTADAIATGCVSALTACVETAFSRLARNSTVIPLLLLTGGDAPLLADKLNKPALLVDNLALHGLAALRTSGEGEFLP
ncbi:type III pantothenate kinase [Chitinilyticum piscinae]|uniref:Type III pantothenate kinase n=1 Tax=Chitinilyticum piscinae TaxID=2866724 RepID=A0A8J7FZL4_9NEIS|nr:type III pantothenate kinase [Chitinilyticum piscinae]MBE9608618.1 type III pantothenate kinase [Chitinilyticum piscinae]